MSFKYERILITLLDKGYIYPIYQKDFVNFYQLTFSEIYMYLIGTQRRSIKKVGNTQFWRLYNLEDESIYTEYKSYDNLILNLQVKGYKQVIYKISSHTKYFYNLLDAFTYTVENWFVLKKTKYTPIIKKVYKKSRLSKCVTY